MNTTLKFYDLSELEAIAREILPVEDKRRADLLREWLLRTGDTDRFDDDATADQIEDGLRDFHMTVAEDRAVERAQRMGRGF